MTDDYPGEDDEPAGGSDYRSYEIYQRERVGESTHLVNPRQLIADAYLQDPFSVPGVLREHYPCYRDWVGNRFWITRYDDVTSVFVDDANYETRPKHHAYGMDIIGGQTLHRAPEVTQAWVDMHDASLDICVAQSLDELVESMATHRPIDIAVDYCDRFSALLFSSVMGTGPDTAEILQHLRRIDDGCGWDERARHAGLQSIRELRRLIAAVLADRRERPAGDLMSVFADLGAGSDDVVLTLVELDRETLPASLANLWCLLLQHRTQFERVQHEPRLMKFAYLEALRHSPPQPTADRFTRHEVERFGRLLPHGALVHLSAAAANRDPRQFSEPDRFDVARRDLCQREPRGQYRADGLPAGITFGHGPPSKLPAVPRDAPRSTYALTRDLAVAASLALLERLPGIALGDGSAPVMRLDRLGGVYRCRSLPVEPGR